MNAPKLRFKEFNDEWISQKLFQLVEFSKGNILAKADLDETGNYPCILYGQLYTKYNEVIREVYSKTNRNENNIPKSKKGDVLIPSSGETPIDISTSSCIQIDNVLLGGDINILRPISCDGRFLSYLINNNKKTEIAKVAQGHSVVHLYNDNLKQISINIPSVQEQKRISDTLELLDKKIELQSKKIEDLKLFKKGLINVLNKKSYQETTLGKIGKFQTSSIDKLVKENEKIVSLYNYMDVYKHKIIMTQDLSKLSKTSAKDNQIITNNLKRGDILFTPSSETPDDIGHSICIQENLPNTVYSYHLLRYRPNIIIDPLFSNYYFNNSKIRKQIIRYATGATRYTVSLDSFLKIKVDIPDLITQKKYGLLLYSTDKKVNKEMFKLNKLRELKKGLMQDMFV